MKNGLICVEEKMWMTVWDKECGRKNERIREERKHEVRQKWDWKEWQQQEQQTSMQDKVLNKETNERKRMNQWIK